MRHGKKKEKKKGHRSLRCCCYFFVFLFFPHPTPPHPTPPHPSPSFPIRPYNDIIVLLWTENCNDSCVCMCTRLSTAGSRAFSVFGPSTWNDLPHFLCLLCVCCIAVHGGEGRTSDQDKWRHTSQRFAASFLSQRRLPAVPR